MRRRAKRWSPVNEILSNILKRVASAREIAGYTVWTFWDEAVGDTIAQRAYWLHNFRLAYRTPDGRLELAGWCRNCFDKAYKNYAFDGSTFQNTTIHFVGDPRTYGGTVTVTF